MLSALAVIAYMLTQLFWVFFGYFGLWEAFGRDIALYDSLTKVAGAVFFVSASTILTYKLYLSHDVSKKEVKMNVKGVVSYIVFYIVKIFKNLLHYIIQKVKVAGVFLKKQVIKVTRSIYSSRKTVLLVVAVFLVTLIFSFLIATWFSSSDYAPSSDKPSSDKPNDDYDRTVPTTGNITVEGLEIYGGDIKYDPVHDTVYVDWGELTIGAYKNVSFYVKSNSNVNVTLALNVTNWEPPGINDYITISWDYNGTVLTPPGELFVTVTLEVASSGDFIDFLVENEVTTFGFDIIVYASGE